MDWKKESEMFNQMADYYDKYRPGYPAEIIDVIIRKANLMPESRVLEIGAGSGKATAQFADNGFEIVCIEPGADLAKKGHDRFIDKNIRFVVSRFEEATVPTDYFDAIISAQAFHWIPQPIGYEKCANALKAGGHLAVFWNMDITGNSDLDRGLMALTEKYGAVACIPEQDYVKRMESIASGIAEIGLFSKPEIIHSHWEKEYSVDEYFGYLSTGNAFIQKTESEKQMCYKELTQLAAKYSGHIRRSYTCELYLARKV